MTYDVLKALHIIFVVTWFAGLFYLFRLFIYHREALDQNGELTASSMRLRFLNEVPTVILIAVIFLIVLRDAVGWIWGVGGILGLALLLTFAIKRYQRARSGRTTGDGT